MEPLAIETDLMMQRQQLLLAELSTLDGNFELSGMGGQTVGFQIGQVHVSDTRESATQQTRTVLSQDTQDGGNLWHASTHCALP